MQVSEIIYKKTQGQMFTPQQRVMAQQQAEKMICNYCALKQVPAALEFVWADMAVDILHGRPQSGVKAMTQGDASISFTENTGQGQYGFLYPYMGELNRFRRFVWDE